MSLYSDEWSKLMKFYRYTPNSISEAGMLVKPWSTADGGFIVFNYGNSEGIGTSDEITKTMFRELTT